MGHDSKILQAHVVASVTAPSAFQPRPFATPEPLLEEAVPDLQLQRENEWHFSFGETIATASAPPPPPKPPRHPSFVLQAKRVAEPSDDRYEQSIPKQPNLLKQIQSKLVIGQVGDRYEQEADRVAAQVVQRLNRKPIQRQEQPEEELQMKPILQREEQPEEEELQMKSILQREEQPEEEELQMKPMLQREDMPEEEELQMKPTQRENVGGGDASSDLESAINSARGNGQSLDANLQTKMGQAMGADFSSVKIHADSQADQLNKSVQAKAFTTGQDIFFRQGEYNPSSTAGQELLAHELTHVVQQNSGVVRQVSQSQEMEHADKHEETISK